MNNRMFKACLLGVPFSFLSFGVTAEIAQTPLFIQSQVKPNIFFLVDDSGSMDWEVLKSSGAEAAHSGNRNSGNVDMTPDYGREYLETCAAYNVLYYDPNETYSPWPGSNDYGYAYGNENISSARTNPYYHYSGKANLYSSRVGYQPWNDSNNNGRYDNGECSGFVSTTSMNSAQRTNFANWYSYYRKREYVAKATLLGIVTNATERMGLATLHRNNSVGYSVADMSVSSNKEGLLTQIELINSSGGTPLRRKLQQVGQYFEGTTSTSLFGASRSSPIQNTANGGACQQNFSVVMSDGYWNGSNPNVGNADSGGTGDWNNTDFDGGTYADSAYNTLADVAMHYYERDLNTTLENKVPVSDLDGNNRQHLVTYTVAFGVNGTLSSGPADGATSFNWPTPSSNSATTVDDMRHAAWNGRGEFLSASSPDTLAQALTDAIRSIESRTASASSVATNSTRVSAGSKIYQARFATGTWTGGLLAYKLNSTTGALEGVAWNAADLIPAENSRKIFTSTASSGSGVVFEHSNLNTTQKGQITAGEVNFIRGDRTGEGTTYRSRGGVLGDIINSDPIYTGKDNFKYYQLERSGTASTYYQYLTGTTANWQKGNRADVLYVGANDGMLHALRGKGIDTAGCNVSSQDCEGEELFAYVPKALISELPKLTRPGYEHQYYVDGPTQFGDAFIKFDGGAARWGTALVGSLGGGGKGLYALDISDPLNFGTADVLWDLDQTDLPRLGYTYSKPSIARLANGKWGVIVGNGYHSSNHEAVLYVLDLETGSVIKEFRTGVFGTAGATNGLSSPRVIDVTNDGIIDAIYAGDLKGNMWKFDVSDTDASKWEIAFSGSPLFKACNADPCTGSDYQPITSKPDAVRANSGGIVLLFGSGKYFEKGDNTSINQVHTFYGILDNGYAVSGRSKLVEQDIIFELSAAQAQLNYNVRVTTDNAVDYPTKKGWFMDFDSASYKGERMVSGPIARNGRIIFSTLVPEADPCAFGGTSWLMEMDAQSGSRLDISPFDLNDDGVIDQKDWVDTDGDGKRDTPASGMESTVGIIKDPGIVNRPDDELKVFSGSSGNIQTVTESKSKNLGRQSWQQLQ